MGADADAEVDINEDGWPSLETVQKYICQRNVEKPTFSKCPKTLESSTVTEKIERLMLSIVTDATKGFAPTIVIPNRNIWTNTTYDLARGVQSIAQPSTKTISWSRGKSAELQFARILYLLSQIYKLICANKYTTKRDIFYQKVDLFGTQNVVNYLVDDISSMLKVPRIQLRILSTSKGCIIGPLTYKCQYSDISTNCQSVNMIPTHVDQITEIQSTAKFILVIEKDASFQKLIETDLFCNVPPCIMITGKGYPDVNTRMMVKKLHEALCIPVLALVDADPHGIEIMCCYRFGSRSLSHDAENMVVPMVRWLGILPTDVKNLSIPEEALIPLKSSDTLKANDLLSRDYIQFNPAIVEQLKFLLKFGKKAEIQCLSAMSQGYLASTYIPAKVKYGELL